MSGIEDDPYPTEEDLQRIEQWDHRDWVHLLVFVKSLWWAPDWGWHEDVVENEQGPFVTRTYRISTGGWSGNESLISALRMNRMFWACCWKEHRRGGHYVFQRES
jgi:hypothetical protein